MPAFFERLTRTYPRGVDLALLLVRVWAGVVMAASHGLGKVSDLSGFIPKVASKGIPLASVLAPAAALSEFLGGLLLALGLFTRVSAAFMLTTMLVAGFVVHAADPFMKKELAFTYATLLAGVLLAGPGRFSLDQWLVRRRESGLASQRAAQGETST
jgi:putative oxidoreductase